MKHLHIYNNRAGIIGTVEVPINHPLIIIWGGNLFSFRENMNAYMQDVAYAIPEVVLSNNVSLILPS